MANSRHANAISSDHVTFIVMPDTGLGGEHLRLSGQMEILEYNRESDDATLPSLSPDGIASSTGLPTDEWDCLEYHLGTDGTIETWLNSRAVSGLTFNPADPSANPNDGGWGTSYKPEITGVYFGWESYAGSVDTVWCDDVSIQATRVGCSAGGGGSSSTAQPSTSTATAKSSTGSTTKPTATSVKPTTSSTTSSSPSTKRTTTTVTTHMMSAGSTTSASSTASTSSSTNSSSPGTAPHW